MAKQRSSGTKNTELLNIIKALEEERDAIREQLQEQNQNREEEERRHQENLAYAREREAREAEIRQEAERRHEEIVQKQLEEANSLRALIEKHNGNEDLALEERRKFLTNNNHDEEAANEIILKEAQKIEDERKSDRKWERKQDKQEARENRRQELANMAPIQRAFAQVGNAIGKPLGFVGDKVGVVLGWFLFIAIVLLIIFSGTLAVYNSHKDACVDLREDSGWGNLFSIWFSQSDFAKCIRVRFGRSLTNLAENLNFIAPISRIFDEQVNIATGGLYYAQVDRNARQPTGIFIENIDTQTRYYADEPITIAANINIKTINSEINGVIQGFLDNAIPCHQLYPINGFFKINQDTSERFLCTFEPNTIRRNGDVPFKIISDFNSKNIAYLRPMIIKRSVWDKYTPEQKSRARSLSETNSLRDSNSPMRIGGKIGNDGNIVLINDYSETTSSTFPFSLSLQSGERNDGWTNGKVRRINNLFIVLPFGIELNPDHITNQESKEFIACRGYTFEKLGSCEEIKEYIDDDSYSEFLCEEKENIYKLNQERPNMNIREFDNHVTLHCVLKTENEKLFTNIEGEKTARVDNQGIKVYSDFQYNVERIFALNVIRRFQEVKRGFITQSCPTTITEPIKSIDNTEINTVTKTNYGSKYQSTFNRIISLDTEITQNKRVIYEALMASITEKYSDFDPVEVSMSYDYTTYSDPHNMMPSQSSMTSYGHFLTGCSLIGQSFVIDNEERDIRCLLDNLKRQMTENNENIEKVLSNYYESAKTIINNQEENIYTERALKSDFNRWLFNLCGLTKVEEDKKTDNNNINNNDVSTDKKSDDTQTAKSTYESKENENEQTVANAGEENKETPA